MESPQFVLFGPAHLATLGGLVLLASALAGLGRSASPRLDRVVRLGLAAGLVLGMALHLGYLAQYRALRILDVLPLHLCDASIFLALFGLLRPGAGRQGGRADPALETLFFWTVTGTFLACVTPALRPGFPDLRHLTYFLLHGGVILAAVYLTIGRRRAFAPGAALRVWGRTLGYAGAVGLVDLALGKNYLYLVRKPAGTLLDLLGPWPWYIAVGAAVALLLFMAVERISQAAGTKAVRS